MHQCLIWNKYNAISLFIVSPLITTKFIECRSNAFFNGKELANQLSNIEEIVFMHDGTWREITHPTDDEKQKENYNRKKKNTH